MYEFESSQNPIMVPLDGVPYYDDVNQRSTNHYNSKRSLQSARLELSRALVQLGALRIDFDQGLFRYRACERHGFMCYFDYKGNRCQIMVVGLPIRDNDSKYKIERVLVQALMNVAAMLSAIYKASVFNPGFDALMVYAVDPDTNK